VVRAKGVRVQRNSVPALVCSGGPVSARVSLFLMRPGLHLSLAFILALPVVSQAQFASSDALAQAKEQIAHGQPEQGIGTLRHLAEAEPATPGAAHALGIALYRTGKLVDAAKAFTQAEKEDPQDIEAVQLHGLSLYRLGQPAEAIPYLQRVRKFTPEANADANYVLGLCYLNSRRYDDARVSFAAQFGVFPDSGSAYLLFARQLMLAKLPEIAEPAAQKALAQDPKLPLGHFMLGEIYLYKSNTDLALAEFEAERKLNASYAPVYERLGDLYSRVGKFSEAQEVLMKALSLDTSSTGPFILMGKVLLRRNDPASALLYLRHAEKMDPDSVTTHSLLGQAYRGVGDQARAKTETDEAARLNSSNQLQLQPVK